MDFVVLFQNRENTVILHNQISAYDFFILGIPFNQLPALEVDGKVIVGQSMAIARYVARDGD